MKVEDGRRQATLGADYLQNARKVASGVARPQGVEGLGMAGPGETLESPWPPPFPRPTEAKQD
jgi:hypothetical protein